MTTHLTTSGRFRFVLVGFACLLVACFSFACAGGGGEEGGNQNEAAGEESAESSGDMASSEGGAPRIWFVTPEDGATVTSPVAFEFGHENFTIEPKGPINEGAGHHHIGVNTECLPPGTAIPEADPWVHFGDGSAIIEMQLEPGEYQFTIQIGDGEHVTLDEPGLCQTISVMVEEATSES